MFLGGKMKGRISTPAWNSKHIGHGDDSASLSGTNANYTLTKLRVQFVSRLAEVASNFGRKGLLYLGQACCSTYTWFATKITRMSRPFASHQTSTTL